MEELNEDLVEPELFMDEESPEYWLRVEQIKRSRKLFNWKWLQW
jgi:hypothetical protein